MIGALLIRKGVLDGFDAFNRRDLDAYLINWSDDVVFSYPGDIPGISGTYSGKASIYSFYERDLAQFPDFQMTAHSICVENIFDLTGTNTVAVQWEFKGTNRAGLPIQNSGVSIMNLSMGKVTRIQVYIFDTGQEFRAAWGQPTKELVNL